MLSNSKESTSFLALSHLWFLHVLPLLILEWKNRMETNIEKNKIKPQE